MSVKMGPNDFWKRPFTSLDKIITTLNALVAKVYDDIYDEYIHEQP